MSVQMQDFVPVLPEIFLLGMACIILMIDLFLTDRTRGITYLLSQATLVGAFLLSLGLSSMDPRVVLHGTVVLDPMASLLKMGVYITTAVAFLYSRQYLRERNLFRGEFFLLGLFAVLGMMVLISAHSLITVYLGLELMSLALYAMVAMQRDSGTASEAAMKYFVLGAMASAMLLYGMSILYGLTGSLDLGEIAQAVQVGEGGAGIVLVFALVFMLIGVAFKLGAVPFHMWIPDVYHGAPTAVTLFVSTAPKLAAFAMLMRLMVNGLGEIHGQWQDILILLGILSVAVGNVVAIAQSNIKRMLAYSGISHIGFLLFGVLTGTAEGFSAAMFYALAYVLMGLASFGMVILLSRAGFESDSLDDFRGLNERSPWFAFMMLVVMFSMAGVPPFLGFWAKLAVFKAVITADADLVWVAVVGVLFSVVGAFYYLRVVKNMYFDKPPEGAGRLESNFDMRVVLSANALAILALGIAPGWLMALVTSAIG
jgi:NADH-quinone oxidoreductase subunit N